MNNISHKINSRNTDDGIYEIFDNSTYNTKQTDYNKIEVNVVIENDTRKYTITQDTFNGIEQKLTKLLIPNFVSNIHYDAFDNCINLEYIEVLEYDVNTTPNPYFQDYNGILYRKSTQDYPKLLKYPVNKNDKYFVAPYNVISVNYNAFNKVKNLEFVIYSNSESEIRYGDF